ncbi:MAG: DNA polymerase III subunit delta' [Anaerolineales bacterium]|nr:DNA polymerase III subunit delta' [Anaerolineales bacterium]
MQDAEDVSRWGIVGHAHAVQALQRAVDSGSPSHAYLITGPHGIGKTTLAQALAAALLCQGAPPSPCGACRACRLVASGSHPDLHLVESERPGASLGIDLVRDLQRQLALTPLEGRWRLAVLGRFEEATTAAANALLKTLEEPPAYVVIMVLADDADRLLPTIVSRCQQVPLHPVPIDEIERALIARWQAEPAQAALLASLSAGHVGWAVRMLTESRALGRRTQRLDELARLLDSPLSVRFQYAESLSRDPVATQETLDLWLSWWRDVLLLASAAGANVTNVDRGPEIQENAAKLGVAQSADVLKALRAATDRIRRNANPRLTLEVLMLDLPRRAH